MKQVEEQKAIEQTQRESFISMMAKLAGKLSQAILTLVARPEGFDGAIAQIGQSQKYFDQILADENDQLQIELKTVV